MAKLIKKKKKKVIKKNKFHITSESPYVFIKQCYDREELKTYVNAIDYQIAFDEIWQRLFRPRHKHGYSNQELNQILNDEKNEVVHRAFDMLEEYYREIIEEYDVR